MEQRSNLRYRALFRSSFSSVAMVGGEGSLLDLSVRGCRIESLIEVKPGATLEVRIEVNESEPPIQIQAAVVRWSREREFGLEFEVIAPTEWGHLQDVVKQVELEPYQRERQAADVPGSV
ncbi:MAG: PilZ domain-containing protein [Nitrospirota bacterium]